MTFDDVLFSILVAFSDIVFYRMNTIKQRRECKRVGKFPEERMEKKKSEEHHGETFPRENFT